MIVGGREGLISADCQRVDLDFFLADSIDKFELRRQPIRLSMPASLRSRVNWVVVVVVGTICKN
jgi:hypothetical protein